jgi:Uma2 family endonuclease
MTAEPIRQMTPEEYLAMEEASDVRNELMNGTVLAMSGNALPHVIIVRNLIFELTGQLRGKSCTVLSNEMKVKVELTGDYFYPDIVGYCGTGTFETETQVTLLNPTLLIEVLSPSTEAYDRGLKFQHYQQIPTLREYVLVSQSEPMIEVYLRNEDDTTWDYRMASGFEASVGFASIGCTAKLADVYRDAIAPKS